MRRHACTGRAALRDDADAPALVDIWSDVLRRVGPDQQVEDIRHVIDRVSAMPEERIVVAEVEGQVVGAVHLRATTFSPINLEPRASR